MHIQIICALTAYQHWRPGCELSEPLSGADRQGGQVGVGPAILR